MALLSAVAAAAASLPATPIGLPDCTTSCGNVTVPYPFGFGPARCYWPGLNLTCDTTGPDPPRLLLGDGTFRVVAISLRNTTIRVIRTGSVIATADVTSDRNVSFGGGFMDHGYRLSPGNELVLSGCNLLATLREDLGPGRSGIISGCASFCSFKDKKVTSVGQLAGKYCSGMACCQAPINYLSSPTRVHLRWLDPSNHTEELTFLPTYVFVAEEGWFDRRPLADELLSVKKAPPREALEVPLVLQWGVKQGLPPPPPDLWVNDTTKGCSGEVVRMLCKSENSGCVGGILGYTCQCDHGFDGNPYLAGGCQGQSFLPSGSIIAA